MLNIKLVYKAGGQVRQVSRGAFFAVLALACSAAAQKPTPPARPPQGLNDLALVYAGLEGGLGPHGGSASAMLAMSVLELRVGFDQVGPRHGGNAEFGFWLPVPLCRAKDFLSCRDRLAFFPEAVLGHGWGTGIGGYVAAGGGLGWVFLKPDGMPLIPFIEYRTRFPFSSQQRADSRIEFGVRIGLPD